MSGFRAIIADSTCLIGLSRIGQLDLIQKLFQRITIAQAVWDEVVVNGLGRPGSLEVAQAEWIDVKNPTDRLAVEALRLSLGAGESESMVLAKEISAQLVILDDAKARLAAQQLGLAVAGTASLIYRAEELQIIGSAALLIQQLQAVGFRLKL
ncbi:MAG: hypothetical protein WBK51_13970 [Polaromonas sp.]